MITSKLTLYSSNNPLKMYHSFHKIIKQHNLFSKLIIINVYLATNQHIRMITEEPCDTEDWSNDAENSALPIQE